MTDQAKQDLLKGRRTKSTGFSWTVAGLLAGLLIISAYLVQL